jgi:hypothetical protein
MKEILLVVFKILLGLVVGLGVAVWLIIFTHPSLEEDGDDE